MTEIRAKIINGEIDYGGKIAILSAKLAYKRHEGKPVTIVLGKKKRSTKQNNYYWGAVLPTISDHTGHTVNELHEAYKKLFLPRKLITVNGKQVYLTGSTQDLSTGGMVEFIMRISAEAAEMGIILPSPEDHDAAPLN